MCSKANCSRIKLITLNAATERSGHRIDPRVTKSICPRPYLSLPPNSATRLLSSPNFLSINDETRLEYAPSQIQPAALQVPNAQLEKVSISHFMHFIARIAKQMKIPNPGTLHGKESEEESFGLVVFDELEDGLAIVEWSRLIVDGTAGQEEAEFLVAACSLSLVVASRLGDACGFWKDVAVRERSSQSQIREFACIMELTGTPPRVAQEEDQRSPSRP